MMAASGFNLINKRHSVLPGFGLSFGITLFWLGLIVLLPFAALLWSAHGMGWAAFVDAVAHERVVAAIRLSFVSAGIAALINLLFGFLVAWVLVRYRFPGKRLIDALVDLPFALPTAVAGIALTTLYAPNGWIGQYLEPLGLKVSFTPLGIIVALTFIGLPFVVRTVQPVLEDLERELEEAATCLGAGRWDIFRRVIFPAALPALITGGAMAFARATGEYGSVIFIAGNIPMVSEIAPLIIAAKLDQFDQHGAVAVALVMLAISFLILFAINLIQWWAARRHGAGK
ncbi:MULTISPECIES: sulfate ABC transporter permease subunit CysT [Chromobacterium]|uniref:Sulfate transport system permease protein CysT n=3 Tax=Chromobacterium TaxID=535 RepID=A0A1W0D4J1_9NEIS|nr:MULTISPECIES: sulfate ABC transporter permease subunit CysT [Chromobacterium]AXT44942.1 sulfate ABC transporter permease subunit CysT [Chromobacterium rhizoryzae]MDH0342589.1 sulfate ABC transporter permease subunit CysT [Chromobacterium haemolyticum]OQS41930.1 sulfate ABC transporter permease subunit CysT [Chromobacterium haemolyticum]PTU72143.1 sulfate ABC transporter permease subunit CysT [Chromobacterium haemolyticum]QOZ81781.1 sulfate ABC transporter permease subunit CysT [Chromobacter